MPKHLRCSTMAQRSSHTVRMACGGLRSSQALLRGRSLHSRLSEFWLRFGGQKCANSNIRECWTSRPTVTVAHGVAQTDAVQLVLPWPEDPGSAASTDSEGPRNLMPERRTVKAYMAAALDSSPGPASVPASPEMPKTTGTKAGDVLSGEQTEQARPRAGAHLDSFNGTLGTLCHTLTAPIPAGDGSLPEIPMPRWVAARHMDLQ